MAGAQGIVDECRGLLGVSSRLAVVKVKGITLDNGDEARGIVGVGGVAAGTQPPRPRRIVGDVVFEQRRIALAKQKARMVGETLGSRGIYPEAFIGGVVIAEEGVAAPFRMTLDAEMIVPL